MFYKIKTDNYKKKKLEHRVAGSGAGYLSIS